MALVGEMVKVQGRVQRNAMFDRVEFVAFSVAPADPEEELQVLGKK